MMKNLPSHRIVFYVGQGAFVGLIILFVTYTEFFFSDRILSPNINAVVTYTSPLFSIDDINEFVISNHKGKVVLKKHLSGAWYICNEKGGLQFFAKEEMIKTLLTESSAIHFKNRYPIDSINKVNYSLVTPMSTLQVGKNQNELFKIVVGITNPVNSSSYITINDSGLIFQIEKFSLNLSILTKEDFSDPVVLPFHFNKISSIEWSENSNGKNSLINNGAAKKLTRDERGNWYDQYGKVVKSQEIENFLKELRSIKSLSFTSRSNLAQAETVTSNSKFDEDEFEDSLNVKTKKNKSNTQLLANNEVAKNLLDGPVLYDLKVNFSDGEMPLQILKSKSRSVASRDKRSPGPGTSGSAASYEVYLVNEGLSANINQDSYGKLSTAIKSLPSI
ncbi:MAG: DUF4340 domain-containing protein [Bacteriovoracaceae bacterium]|nr:DUF4340 domain-containing protein [Bacteriovoracaceae bacterium]